jgi:hypothetical protein
MTGAELKAKAIKIYGEEHWEFALAAALKCSRVTVWRYSKQAEVPYLVERAVLQLGRKKYHEGTNDEKDI